VTGGQVSKCLRGKGSSGKYLRAAALEQWCRTCSSTLHLGACVYENLGAAAGVWLIEWMRPGTWVDGYTAPVPCLHPQSQGAEHGLCLNQAVGVVCVTTAAPQSAQPHLFLLCSCKQGRHQGWQAHLCRSRPHSLCACWPLLAPCSPPASCCSSSSSLGGFAGG
jgi:hypothetical protein